MRRTSATLPLSDLMNLSETCLYLKKSRTWLYRAMSIMDLPAHRMGKRWTFSRAEVDRWFRALPGVNLPIAG